MTKPETSEPEEVPALVARVQPAAQIPLERPKPVPPQVKDGATTRAQMDHVNADRTIENKVMTERGARFEPSPSDRNAASQGVCNGWPRDHRGARRP